MTVEYIEEVAQEKGLRGKEQQEYERMLDQALDKERVFRLWHWLYIISAGLFLWFVLFTCILFLLGLEGEFEIPLQGIGMFLVVVLLLLFPIFIISMFLSSKYGRELSSYEARVLAFLESI